MWFAPFGFAKGLEDHDSGDVPHLLEHGLALVGTADTVSTQLERLRARLPVSWLFAWTYNGLVPHGRLMRSIESFATKVLPRVTEPRAPEPRATEGSSP